MNSTFDVELLEKYKNGEIKLKEVCTHRVNGDYPQLYQFYQYLLLGEEAHKKERCLDIFHIVLSGNTDDFWKVLLENLESGRILFFICSCLDSDIFLQWLYDQLSLKQVEVIAKHLYENGTPYSEQVEFYLCWQEEIEDSSFTTSSFAVVRTLAELEGSDLDELAINHYGLFNYLERWRQEDV